MSIDIEIKKLIDNESDLMVRFKEIAPGTFRHCESVASLVDAVCSELDYVNRDDLYVAAKLHDIGKILNPYYFCENQTKDKNIHNDLDRDDSYQFISRHVSDSLLILLQYNEINRKILEYISQHHGNSPIRSICKSSSDFEKYRYNAFPPQTVEACILMICDVVEAATRAFFTKGKLKNIKKTVIDLIDTLVEDKQLDYLRIGELRIIRRVLISELGNLYHKRIEYDDSEKKTSDSTTA